MVLKRPAGTREPSGLILNAMRVTPRDYVACHVAKLYVACHVAKLYVAMWETGSLQLL
jgi:hypothetical protein